MNRRQILQGGAFALASLPWCSGAARDTRRPPNFIVVLCDDLGYGDISAFGAKRVRTPNLDRMTREGTVLTDFYAAANLCTPSRAGLLTGRYPIRTGLASLVSDTFHSKFNWLERVSFDSTVAASFNNWSRDCFSNGVTLRI